MADPALQFDLSLHRSRLLVKESSELKEKHCKDSEFIEMRLKSCSRLNYPLNQSLSHESELLPEESLDINLSSELPDNLLQSKIKDLTEKMIEKERNTRETEERIDHIIQKREDLVKDNKTLRLTLKSLQRDFFLSELNKKNSEDILSLSYELSHIEKEKIHLARESTNLKNELKRLDNRHTREIEGLQKRIEDLQSIQLVHNVKNNYSNHYQQERRAVRGNHSKTARDQFQSSLNRVEKLEAKLKKTTQKFNKLYEPYW